MNSEKTSKGFSRIITRLAQTDTRIIGYILSHPFPPCSKPFYELLFLQLLYNVSFTSRPVRLTVHFKAERSKRNLLPRYLLAGGVTNCSLFIARRRRFTYGGYLADDAMYRENARCSLFARNP